MRTSVLVTGGAGFVGSSLARVLLERGYRVLVLDNLVNGHRSNLPAGPDLEFLQGDITSATDIERALKLGPQWVVHLAAHHFIPFCDQNPTETIRVNVLGTQRLLECLAKEGQVDRLVFASTAAVYAPQAAPCCEKDPVRPIDIYGISKKCGEEMVELFHKRTGIRCASARLFNVVGPRETNPHLLPDIIDQLGEEATEISLGNLVPRRDYIYVDDVARGILCLLESDRGEGAYNIGTGHAYNPAEVVEKIARLLGRQITIRSVSQRQRQGDRPWLIADNDKLSGLGWKCENALTDALQQTLQYYNVAKQHQAA